MPSTVLVTRGDLVESRHRVSLAVVRADGARVAASGDQGLVAFWRSCAKFFQALPLVADGAADALGIDDEELALACASHNGEDRHVAVARRLLAHAGAAMDDLVCGPHASISDDVERDRRTRGLETTRAHSNCSGKHAAMLALARHRGWSRDYADPRHPLQRRCLEEVARWADLPVAAVPQATDGCGVPSFALPLEAMALAYARLGAAAAGDPVPAAGAATAAAARRLLAAVREHPFLLAGTGRLDTDLIRASGGRIVAKVGAEGVYCAAIPELRLGLALKVEDGASRALDPTVLALLEAVAPGFAPALEAYRAPEILNTRGATVGRVEARIELHRDA